MGFSLRDIWERSDFWDKEENAKQKLVAQTRRTTANAQPAQTRNEPAITLSKKLTSDYQATKPKQNLWDKVTDRVDANSNMDRWKRLGLGMPELYQDEQRAKGIADRSININPAQRLVNFGRATAEGRAEAPIALGRGVGNAVAITSDDYKKAQESEQILRDTERQTNDTMFRLLKNGTPEQQQNALNYLNKTQPAQTGMDELRAKIASENDPKRLASAGGSLVLDFATLGVAGASKQGIKQAYQGAKATQVANGANKARQVTTGLVAGTKKFGVDTAKTATMGGASGGLSAYIQDPNATFETALQGTKNGALFGTALPTAFIGLGYAKDAIKPSTKLVKPADSAIKPAGPKIQNIKAQEKQLSADLDDLIMKRSWAEIRNPELVSYYDKAIDEKYTLLKSVKKSIKNRDNIGAVRNPLVNDDGTSRIGKPSLKPTPLEQAAKRAGINLDSTAEIDNLIQAKQSDGFVNEGMGAYNSNYDNALSEPRGTKIKDSGFGRANDLRQPEILSQPEAKAQGWVDVRGQKAETPEKVAELLKDYRNPDRELTKSYTGDGNVLEMQVPAKHILDDKNSPLGEEYLYRPTQATTPPVGKTEATNATSKYNNQAYLDHLVKNSKSEKDSFALATILSKIDFAKNGFKSKEDILANRNKLLNELTVDQYMRLTTEDRINMYTQKMVDDLNNYNLDKYRFEKKSIASKIEDQLLNRQATIRVLEHPRGNIGIGITEYGDDTLVFITNSSQSYDNIAQMTGLKPGSFKTVYVEVLRGKTGQAKTGQPYLAYQDGRSQAIVMDLVNKIIEKENLGVKPPAPIDIPWLDIRQKLFNINDRSLKVSDAINGAQAKNAQRIQAQDTVKINKLRPSQMPFNRVALLGGIKGDTRQRMSKTAEKVLNDKRNNQITTSEGMPVVLSAKGNSKYTHTKQSIPNDLFEKKMRITPKIEEALNKSKLVANNERVIKGIAPDGFVYQQVPVKSNGNLDYHNFDVGINNAQKRNTLYYSNIKETPASPGVKNNLPGTSVSKVTIPTKPKNVNGLSTATTPVGKTAPVQKVQTPKPTLQDALEGRSTKIEPDSSVATVTKPKTIIFC
jgi:hypothetical protein